MSKPAQLEREQAFDAWLDERFGQQSLDAVAEPRVAERWDEEMEAMSRVAELVGTHLRSSAAASKLPRSGIGGPMMLRVAAVVILVAALALGVTLAATRGHGERATGRVIPGSMPGGLYDQLVTQAGSGGNPYPSAPVYWVETTASRAVDTLQGYGVTRQVGADVPGTTPVWVAEVTSSFYGDPEHRSGIYHTILDVWTPERTHPDAGFGGQATGKQLPSLAELQQLGTVHYQFLRRPAAAPAMPAWLRSRMETFWHGLFRQGVPVSEPPVMWVQTTIGQLGAGVVDSPDVRLYGWASLPGLRTVWVVETILPPTTSAHSVATWYLTTGAGRAPVLREPLGQSRLDNLATLGAVHEMWLTGGAPEALSPQLQQMLSAMLHGQYQPVSGQTVVTWVGTTAGRLYEIVPWAPFPPTVPSATPVWIVLIHVAGHHPLYPDEWLIDSTGDPSSSRLRYMDESQGGSSLLGITHLSQLGVVHRYKI